MDGWIDAVGSPSDSNDNHGEPSLVRVIALSEPAATRFFFFPTVEYQNCGLLLKYLWKERYCSSSSSSPTSS